MCAKGTMCDDKIIILEYVQHAIPCVCVFATCTITIYMCVVDLEINTTIRHTRVSVKNLSSYLVYTHIYVCVCVYIFLLVDLFSMMLLLHSLATFFCSLSLLLVD